MKALTPQSEAARGRLCNIQLGIRARLATLPPPNAHESNSHLTETTSTQKTKEQNRMPKEALELIENYASLVSIDVRKADFSDPKDNYLLDLCNTIGAEYLVTGDTLLLNLRQHNQTKIVKYRDFCDLIGI